MQSLWASKISLEQPERTPSYINLHQYTETSTHTYTHSYTLVLFWPHSRVPEGCIFPILRALNSTFHLTLSLTPSPSPSRGTGGGHGVCAWCPGVCVSGVGECRHIGAWVSCYLLSLESSQAKPGGPVYAATAFSDAWWDVYSLATHLKAGSITEPAFGCRHT